MTTVAGPSGGVLGDGDNGAISQSLYDKHPGLARQLVTTGRYPRAGHDRARWPSVDWDDYRARVGVAQRQGPWRIDAIEAVPGDVNTWIEQAEQLPPTPAGWYTALYHQDRGLVMSDVPGEIAGSLPFTDAVAAMRKPHVLIAGLGLGIVPAWLLARTSVWRVDVIEIDPDVIELITRDRRQPYAPNDWTAHPRLHVYQGDAHTWWPSDYLHCALHTACAMWRGTGWDAVFFDIWDTISARNLPSMHRLHRRFGRRADRMWSWERTECEAMRARGQTLDRPCFISGTGYVCEAPDDAPV